MGGQKELKNKWNCLAVLLRKVADQRKYVQWGCCQTASYIIQQGHTSVIDLAKSFVYHCNEIASGCTPSTPSWCTFLIFR